MPECFSIEAMIDGYSHHYGIDPDVTEKKDIMKLIEFQVLRNREAVILRRKTDDSKNNRGR